MSRRALVLWLLLAAGLVAACGGDGGADVGDVDADAVLEASADRMEGLQSFHFVVEHENGTTPIVRGLGMTAAEGDVVGAGRMRLDVTARLGTTNVRVGIVVLPEASYISNPITGRWEEEEIDVREIFDPATGVTGLMRQVTEVEAVDREEVDGIDAYVLESSVDAGNLTPFVSTAQPGTPVDVRVWVGVEDPVVHRIEVAGRVAPDDADDIVRRITLSRFDEPIEIAAPE